MASKRYPYRRRVTFGEAMLCLMEIAVVAFIVIWAVVRL